MCDTTGRKSADMKCAEIDLAIGPRGYRRRVENGRRSQGGVNPVMEAANGPLTGPRRAFDGFATRANAPV